MLHGRASWWNASFRDLLSLFHLCLSPQGTCVFKLGVLVVCLSKTQIAVFRLGQIHIHHVCIQKARESQDEQLLHETNVPQKAQELRRFLTAHYLPAHLVFPLFPLFPLFPATCRRIRPRRHSHCRQLLSESGRGKLESRSISNDYVWKQEGGKAPRREHAGAACQEAKDRCPGYVRLLCFFECLPLHAPASLWAVGCGAIRELTLRPRV